MDYNNIELNPLIIEEKYNLFSNIFSYKKYDKSFLDYLKDTAKPSNNVCAKIFIKNEKAIQCKECAKYDTSIICIDCYEKSKDLHRGHTILYETYIEGGCCDCGNPEVWEKKSFCPSHKGSFLNKEEINNFIKDNFNEDIIKKIQQWCKDIINTLTPYFLKMEKKINSFNNCNNLNKILSSFLNFSSDIFNSNSALLHLFYEEFIKNYPFETEHNCVVINEKNEAKILNYDGKTHLCECSFLRILLSVWTNDVSNGDFLFFFLQNNDMKIKTALIYLGIYDKILENKSNNILDYFEQDFISELVLKSIKSPFLIVNIVKCFYHYLKEFINKGDFQIEEEGRSILNRTIHNLLRKEAIYLFSENIELFEYYLKIIGLMNNINKFEIVYYFKHEGYSSTLIKMENTLLDIFIYLISFFNFDNIELTKKLFNLYDEQFKNYKFLDSNCYSFHITLLRSFSILLNRFCFHYSIKNNSNFYNAINYIKLLLPNYRYIFDILIKEQMKFFGFLLSIESNNFIYYGEDMKKYANWYFFSDIFHLTDLNLIKLMLCLEENKNYFSIFKILELCNVNNSHSNLISNVLSNLDNPNFDFINEEKEKNYIKLNKKILEYFIKIIKNNSCFYGLYDYTFKYNRRTKIEDKYEQYLLDNEQNSIKNIIRERIINFSMIKQNLFNYTDFHNYIHIYFFEDNNIIQQIFEEMTYKTIQNDGQVKFSLKNEYIKNFDVDYILDPLSQSKAQQYIIDFKKKEISLLNNYFYESFEIMKELYIQSYYNFLYYNNNIQFIINFAIKLISNLEYKSISDIFLLIIIKLILIFIYIDKNIIGEIYKKDKNNFYLEINTLLNKLLNILNSNINLIVDEDKKSIYQYLQINILKYLNIEIKENQKESINENKKNNKKLIEKYKKKFKEKNLEFSKAKSIEKVDEFEECILCHLPLINKEDNKFDIFVINGINIKDYFIHHCKKLTIKNEFEKYNKNPNIDFQSFYKDYKIISTRILSCNHKMHFSCYNQFMINILTYSDTKEYNCPLCKKICNLYIPYVIFYYNNTNNDYISKLLSGFCINDFFNEDFIQKETVDENIFINPSIPEIQNILNSSKFFIENCFYDGLLLSFLSKPDNYNFFFDVLIKEFSNFLIYYNIMDDNKIQIDIWTNLILCIRILLKTKLLNINIFISEFHKIINFFNIKEDDTRNYIHLFFNNTFFNEINKLLFVTLVLFDLKNAERYFIDLLSPFISIVSFIKNLFLENGLNLSPAQLKKSLNVGNFKNYINDNNKEFNLKKSFDIFLEKIYVFSLINNKKFNKDYLDKNKIEENIIIINPYKELFLEKFEDKPVSEIIFNLRKIIPLDNSNPLNIIFNKNNNSNDRIIDIIFNKFSNILEIISLRLFINQDLLLFGNKLYFKFIALEKNLLAHLTYIQSKKCINCGKDKVSSLLCLLCGEKFCNDSSCKAKEDNTGNNTNYYELHSRICNLGNVAYITDYGKIIFYYHEKPINSFNGVFLNQFGEEYRMYESITNNYLLIEKNYEKMEKIFIHYTFMKNNN